MKNLRPLIVILMSIVVGVVAVGLAAKWVASRGKVAMSPVVVAARDIDVGTRLSPDMLTVVDWPATAPLADAFSDPAALSERVVNTQVLKGEPLLGAKLAAPGEKGGLSAVLGEGKRAVTVKVNEIVGVAGFALPGNYVDVMVNTPDQQDRAVSKIVLERILVLAVAQDASTGETKPRVVNAVTLEVTPPEAEKLDLARSVGSLSLVLRSQIDKNPVTTTGARKDDLLGSAPAAAAGSQARTAPAQARHVARPHARPAARAASDSTPSAEPVEVIRGLRKSDE